jgi:hypothetical protein
MRGKLALVPSSALEEIWNDLPPDEAGCSGGVAAEGETERGSKRTRLQSGTSGSKPAVCQHEQPSRSSPLHVLPAAPTAEAPTVTPHASAPTACAERGQGAAGEVPGGALRSSSEQSAEGPAQERPEGRALPQVWRQPDASAAEASADADADACGAPVGTFWASVSRGWRRRPAALGPPTLPAAFSEGSAPRKSLAARP